jgi:hypothetical protein
MSAAQIKEELQKRWQGDPIVMLCVSIVDFVAALPPDQRRMLTFRTLSKAVGRDRVDDELMRALTILVSSRVAAFDAHAMLVDDDESEHEIDPTELAHARSTGELIHPETGRPVAEFETRVIPFFVPSARFSAGE